MNEHPEDVLWAERRAHMEDHWRYGESYCDECKDWRRTVTSHICVVYGTCDFCGESA